MLLAVTRCEFDFLPNASRRQGLVAVGSIVIEDMLVIDDVRIRRIGHRQRVMFPQAREPADGSRCVVRAVGPMVHEILEFQVLRLVADDLNYDNEIPSRPARKPQEVPE